MLKSLAEFIVIPISKFILHQDEGKNTLSLEESHLFLLKSLVLSSSKEKYVYLTSNEASDFRLIDDTFIRNITNYVYSASNHFFTDNEKGFLDVNVVIQSMNLNFIDCLDSKAEKRLTLLSQQNDEIACIRQKCHAKAISVMEFEFDQTSTFQSINMPFIPTPKQLASNAQNRVALGGTFDHLHIGHKVLLSNAAYLAKKSLVCGVMDPSALSKKKYFEFLEPLETRIENVRSFLKLIRPELTAEIVTIFDAFGPTITDPTIDTLVVSQETKVGADSVNQKRAKLKYTPLVILTLEVISSSSDNDHKKILAKLSSTFIREKLSKGLYYE